NDRLIAAMVGREIRQVYPKEKAEIGREVLRLEGLSRTGYFRGVSFSVHAGEIFALTGLVGAGRTEVCQCIFGIEKPTAGTVFFEGKPLAVKRPRDAMNAGIGYLPEDRQKQGLMLDWEIFKNETISTLGKYLKGGLLSTNRELAESKRLSEEVAVKATSVYDKASSLSGGNQQKVIVAKLLSSDLKLIIMDEPTKGVDVGAKSQIYKIMSDLAGKGYAIIMVSSELPEVLGMADTVAVMCGGSLTKILPNENLTQEEILYWAMPQSAEQEKENTEKAVNA
ncbi:MAG: ATP-binding cassette domain-containing protein, partial [Eubacteriales bacterium]